MQTNHAGGASVPASLSAILCSLQHTLRFPLTRPLGTLSHRMGEGRGEGERVVHPDDSSANQKGGASVPASRPCAFASLAFLLITSAALAFPPAPRHTLFGVVRDAMGEPLVVTNAVVILETSAQVRLRTSVSSDPRGGINYQLAVPMDAGLTADAYKPTALRPTTPFQLKVVIGTRTYYPMEVSANFANLGKPARRTRMDLTLGEDTDGDGLPDAWERAMMSLLGGERTLQDIRPGDDADHDGLSNLAEYQAGTYAFDPADGFELTVIRLNDTAPILEFLAIRGRSYSIVASSDLQHWTRMSFRDVTAGAGAPTVGSYTATDVRRVQVEVPLPEGMPSNLFFKAMVE